MVEKSTCGSGTTGSNGHTAALIRKITMANSVVPIERLMKVEEMLACRPRTCHACSFSVNDGAGCVASADRRHLFHYFDAGFQFVLAIDNDSLS